MQTRTRIPSIAVFFVLLLMTMLAAQLAFAAEPNVSTSIASPNDDDDGGGDIDDDGDFDDDDDGVSGNYVEIYGVVSSLPTNLFGTWVVNGVSYTTNASTRFEAEHGPFVVGSCVEMKILRNTTTVHQIETEEGYHCNGGSGGSGSYARVYGTVTSFPSGLHGTWVVNGVSYTANASTYFEQEYGGFAVGACVEIDYLATTNTAIKIERENSYHCGTSGTGGHYGNGYERYGRLDAFPSGLIGSWVIAGVTYQAGSGTRFEQEDGAFAVGRCVEIKYLSDTNAALEIETEDSYHCGGSGGTSGSYAEVYGTVTSFPTGLYGNWVVNGVTYSADATTQFNQYNGAFANNTCVEIKFQTANNLAIEIETEHPYHCGSSTTVPAAESASLTVNHQSGADGSNFVFVGDNFAPDSTVVIHVNGKPVTPFARTNSAGWVTFAIQGDSVRAAGLSGATISLAGAGGQTVTLNNAQPLRSLPANYSAPTLDLNNLQTLANQVFIPIAVR